MHACKHTNREIMIQAWGQACSEAHTHTYIYIQQLPAAADTYAHRGETPYRANLQAGRQTYKHAYNRKH